MRRTVWLVPVLALVLTACSGGDPQAQLRADVEAVTLAANDGDADGVRDAVEDLLSTIRRQVANRELPREEGERLRAIALRITENAGLLDPEPEPTQEPTQEPEPEPTEEEPSPTPEPEPTEEPEEPEETEEPEEPEETEEPIIEISPAASESSPSPEPDAESSPQAAAASSPSPSS